MIQIDNHTIEDLGNNANSENRAFESPIEETLQNSKESSTMAPKQTLDMPGAPEEPVENPEIIILQAQSDKALRLLHSIISHQQSVLDRMKNIEEEIERIQGKKKIWMTLDKLLEYLPNHPAKQTVYWKTRSALTPLRGLAVTPGSEIRLTL